MKNEKKAAATPGFSAVIYSGYSSASSESSPYSSAAALGIWDLGRYSKCGCGAGYWLRELVKWGARPENLTGNDLLADRVAVARRLCAPAVKLECASAAQLPFSDATFDLVLQSTVFTSILDADLKRRVAAEMLRVLKSQQSSEPRCPGESSDRKLPSYFPIAALSCNAQR